jgi:queuine tRNA-ribosyltransferase
VEACTSEDLVDIGVKMILANTYHLYLRPGYEIIQALGGLHRFMNWHRPILTDSGGFQIYSLSALREISEDGVIFRSHIDGSEHAFTPEKAMEIQAALDADIAMVLDECIPYPSTYAYTKKSVRRTVEWAERCRRVEPGGERALFGIVQGGVFPELRAECAEALCSIGFEGYGIGGLGLGEGKDAAFSLVEASVRRLPAESPRYLMGMGNPEDLLEAVARGIDMFDCVIPTRNARNGSLFTCRGKMNIKNARYAGDELPVDTECECSTCRNYSRAYLRHLFLSRELSVYRLISIHNLFFYEKFMERMRQAILEERFSRFRGEFYSAWQIEEDGEQEYSWEATQGRCTRETTNA